MAAETELAIIREKERIERALDIRRADDPNDEVSRTIYVYIYII